MPLVEIASGIDGGPQPHPDKRDAADAEAEATFQFALGAVESVRATGAVFVETIGVAPEVGRLAAYGTLQGVSFLAAASTGTPIRELHGIARENAALARLGLGTRANGGAGVAGGRVVLAGIRLGAEIFLQVGVLLGRERRKQRELLGRIESALEATQPGFEALEDVLPAATKVMDDIAVHGGRALNRWDPRPCRWDSLDPAHRQVFQELLEISACQLAVASIDFQELLETTADDRERLIERADIVVSRSLALVGSLV